MFYDFSLKALAILNPNFSFLIASIRNEKGRLPQKKVLGRISKRLPDFSRSSNIGPAIYN